MRKLGAALAMTLAGCGGSGGGNSSQLHENLARAPGYVDLMDPAKAAALKSLLPAVDDPDVQAALRSAETMWYDKDSLKPVYQDSVTPILGVRANAIGRELAVDGQKVFDTAKHFHFPFGVTAGLDRTPTVYVANFWAPPKQGDRTLPVVWWQDDTTRWRWMFPKGTLIGEVMFLKDAAGELFVFEIRTRRRFLEGWGTNAYRPFPTAPDLEAGITLRRPAWARDPTLTRVMTHLRDRSTLVAGSLRSTAFPATFDQITGSLDHLPDLGDPALVKDLLRTTVFRSAEGQIWKSDGQKETYAASTKAAFSIVPADYEGGLIPVNDVSCNRCHEDTGRQIGEFSFNSLLYGEIWGEDRIFSWHLFDESGNFGGAYHNNRVMSRKLKAAGLVEDYRPGTHPPDTYNTLPRRFRIIYR